MTKKIRFSHIVCIGQNNEIGYDNKLLYKFKEDLEHFKSKTIGSVVIMGRKTYDSIGKPLVGRINIVISRTMKSTEGVFVVGSISEAIKLAKSAAIIINNKEVFIIGGAQIYDKTINLVDRVYLTRVRSKQSVSADSYYPDIESTFSLVENSCLLSSGGKDLLYQFETWVKLAR